MFAALRAMCCSMDGLSGPFLSPKVDKLMCLDCDYSLVTNNNNSHTTLSKCLIKGGKDGNTIFEIEPNQCSFKPLNKSIIDESPILCKNWSFNFPENGHLMNTLSVEQSLVCDREWLKSFTNSMYYVGATFGLLFWGFISDKYGRKTAYIYSHIITLIFGFSSLFVTNIWTYIFLRSVNAFGMIGELIPRSIQVEIVASRYRFICSVICQTGWAMGIILLPVLSYSNPNYKFILSIPVALTVLMSPWLYWLPESARWMIINNKYKRAHDELTRAANINSKHTKDTSNQIRAFSNQVLREKAGSDGDISENTNASISKKTPKLGVVKSLAAIFTNIHLLRNTMSVFLLLFVAEVVYFSLTLNVADLGGSLHLNFLISGFSELISIATCGSLLAYFSRRVCLSALLLASTVSYLMMALVNIYEHNLSMAFILGVNAFGKITAIGNLMVIILVSQEVFPTVIRQFGTSLCITVGKMGSAVAPFTHELGQKIGHSYCFGMFSAICFSCAFVPMCLSETGNCELPDTVVDIEEGNDSKKNKKKMNGIALGILPNEKKEDCFAVKQISTDNLNIADDNNNNDTDKNISYDNNNNPNDDSVQHQHSTPKD